nr:integrase, catalytic region, zinc finger, CCHC-type, peptidase aspartic, catalytic [Tanacetum cinerariifolium]
MTSGQISSELDLTYAPSTITKQQPTEGELDLLFEAMYDDYFGGQPSATVENVPPAQEPQYVDELNPNAMADGCSKHMIGNLKLLINFIWKFLGTVRFGNDHVVAILGFGDLQWGNILITRVYFIKGLGHNLLLVGQFYDSDLEVAFRSNTCFVRNLEGVDLLKGNHTTNLYTINLHDMASSPPICLMARATSSKSWLWHQRSKDEAPEEIKTFLKKITVLLQALVIIVRIDNGTEFKYQVLQEYFAEAIATACYTQNRSIIHCRFDKTPYKLINGKKLDISLLYVFEALYYPKNDHEDIGKLGANGDIGLVIGYSANSCAYRVYNRRTKKIMEIMNVTFNELSAMAFEQSSELDLLFESMYDDHVGGQPSAAPRTIPAAQAPQVLQNPTATTTIADTAPTPKNLSSQVTSIPSTSQNVDKHKTQQQHVQHQSVTIAANVLNNHFLKVTIDPTLFIRRFDDDILVVQVYVDDIIFGSTHPRICVSIRLICLSPLDVDTVSGLWLSHQQYFNHYDSKSAITMSYNPTDYQLADLFTKALPVDRFNYLVRRLGMRSLSPQELDHLTKSE